MVASASLPAAPPTTSSKVSRPTFRPAVISRGPRGGGFPIGLPLPPVAFERSSEHGSPQALGRSLWIRTPKEGTVKPCKSQPSRHCPEVWEFTMREIACGRLENEFLAWFKAAQDAEPPDPDRQLLLCTLHRTMPFLRAEVISWLPCLSSTTGAT